MHAIKLSLLKKIISYTDPVLNGQYHTKSLVFPKGLLHSQVVTFKGKSNNKHAYCFNIQITRTE